MNKPSHSPHSLYSSPNRGEVRRGALRGTAFAHNAPTPSLPRMGRGLSITLLILCLTLTAWGVKRPLLRPKDIPAYEEQQRKKREKLEQDEIELNRIDADATAKPTTPPKE